MARVHLDRIPHTFFGANIKRAVLNHVSVVCSRDTSDIRPKKNNVTVAPPNFFSRFTPPQFCFLILAQIHALYDADTSSAALRVSSAEFRVSSARSSEFFLLKSLIFFWILRKNKINRSVIECMCIQKCAWHSLICQICHVSREHKTDT